jgi:hypothetical protein
MRFPKLGSSFEILEDRTVPDAFGVPWPDPGHLTLSFAPDGTATPDGPSTLSGTMSSAGTSAAWQREILRAFQTWAVNANINIGLVKDGGQPIGTPGAVQGDARFGDVRITAVPVGTGEVGDASPFSWTGTTYSGDVFLGSNFPFSIGPVAGKYDLYSVAAHEAGHVFGLDHSTESGSVMNAAYAYHSGLSAGDVANIQALYGARAPGPNNGSIAQAAAMASNSLTEFESDGDVSAIGQTDYYKFSVPPLLGLTGVSVRLKADGVSLLTPSVSVYDASGRLLTSGLSTDPENNDVSLTFPPSLLGGTYYVKVTGATKDVFGVGSYKLVVDYLSLNTVLSAIPIVPALTTDLGLNGVIGLATDLVSPPKSTPDARFTATYRGAITSKTDVDWFRIHAPAGTTSQALNVLVWGLDANPLDPTIHVADASGNPVAFQVISNDSGIMSVRVPATTPGAAYYVEVAARDPNGAHGTGGYFLGADFDTSAMPGYDGVTSDTLQPAQQKTGTITIAANNIFEFALSAAALGSGGGAVSMTITDATGAVVMTLGVTAGQPTATRMQYLAAGTYTVTYSYQTVSGTSPSGIGFNLSVLEVSDPIGPYSSGTTGGGSTSGGTGPGYTYSGTSPSNTNCAPYYF